ncbi:MAG: sigma-70 family RNA polymerase sigma factor [Phycisphaeraceae bacterium]
MAEPSEIERYLLDGVRAGRAEAWSRLVERYQGRLLSFARRQLGQNADAEDAVQETFVRFVRSLDRFQGQASLETYLFTILRRHIIDQFRGRSRAVFALQDQARAPARDDPIQALPADDPTASWHLRRDEQQRWMADALGEALAEITERLRQEFAFEQLEMLDLLFAAQLPNQQLAAVMNVPAQQVGVVKHRWLKRIALAVAARRGDTGDDHAAERALLAQAPLLTRLWQEQRPTCPKRSTLGHHLLGTLDPAWSRYVRFHLETLGCAFCRASLDDLHAQTEAAQAGARLRDRIMASTAGFLGGR